jgi:N-glycosylase/DNA lyase
MLKNTYGQPAHLGRFRAESTGFSRLPPDGVSMRGSIPLSEPAGGFDLRATIESGQTYLWHRRDGRMFDAADDGGWYHAVIDGEVLRVRQSDGQLEWHATTDADALLSERFRFEDDLWQIRETAPSDEIVQTAYDRFWGLRIVSDPFFPTLISFICSAQMHVRRIASLQQALRETYGETVTLGEETYHTFPAPETLAATSEAELRDLGLGYRAPYVRETARMVADGSLTQAELADLSYEAARERLTEFVGVGQKVADCVCLFALSYLEAIPLDTWMQTALEEFYPDCQRDSYAATSAAFRETLGGAYAGYTQTYLFYHLRTRD